MDVKVYSLAADGDKYLTPHFQVKEFRCRDGSDVVLIHEQLPWDLESIRYQASQQHVEKRQQAQSAPLRIRCGYPHAGSLYQGPEAICPERVPQSWRHWGIWQLPSLR